MSPLILILNLCADTAQVVPIVGAKNAAQVRDNLGAIGWRLLDREVADLESAADAVPRGATQNIFQPD